MKKLILVASLACASAQALAEKPLPEGITPIAEPLVLRFQPHHLAKCVENKSEKAPGDFFSKKSTETSTLEVFLDGDTTKIGLRTELQGGGFLRFIFAAKEDRTGVVAGEPELQTNLTLSEKDKEELGKVKLLFSKFMEKASEIGVMGKPITQGYQLLLDYCSVFGATTFTSEGGTIAIGTSQIRGRESVIFKQDISSTCLVDKGELSFRTTGWSAYDVESGLFTGSSEAVEVSALGKKGSSISDKECTVTGDIKTLTPVVKKIDQRLFELKGLLDKGLISKDEYDKKRSVILESI